MPSLQDYRAALSELWELLRTILERLPMLMLMTFLFFGAIVALSVIGVVGFFLERRDWNRGQCRKCGCEWRYFDTDRQGGRGYRDDHGHYLWISCPLDKRHAVARLEVR